MSLLSQFRGLQPYLCHTHVQSCPSSISKHVRTLLKASLPIVPLSQFTAACEWLVTFHFISPPLWKSIGMLLEIRLHAVHKPKGRVGALYSRLQVSSMPYNSSKANGTTFEASVPLEHCGTNHLISKEDRGDIPNHSILEREHHDSRNFDSIPFSETEWDARHALQLLHCFERSECLSLLNNRLTSQLLQYIATSASSLPIQSPQRHLTVRQFTLFLEIACKICQSPAYTINPIQIREAHVRSAYLQTDMVTTKMLCTVAEDTALIHSLQLPWSTDNVMDFSSASFSEASRFVPHIQHACVQQLNALHSRIPTLQIGRVLWLLSELHVYHSALTYHLCEQLWVKSAEFPVEQLIYILWAFSNFEFCKQNFLQAFGVIGDELEMRLMDISSNYVVSAIAAYAKCGVFHPPLVDALCNYLVPYLEENQLMQHFAQCIDVQSLSYLLASFNRFKCWNERVMKAVCLCIPFHDYDWSGSIRNSNLDAAHTVPVLSLEDCTAHELLEIVCAFAGSKVDVPIQWRLYTSHKLTSHLHKYSGIQLGRLASALTMYSSGIHPSLYEKDTSRHSTQNRLTMSQLELSSLCEIPVKHLPNMLLQLLLHAPPCCLDLKQPKKLCDDFVSSAVSPVSKYHKLFSHSLGPSFRVRVGSSVFIAGISLLSRHLATRLETSSGLPSFLKPSISQLQDVSDNADTQKQRHVGGIVVLSDASLDACKDEPNLITCDDAPLSKASVPRASASLEAPAVTPHQIYLQPADPQQKDSDDLSSLRRCTSISISNNSLYCLLTYAYFDFLMLNQCIVHNKRKKAKVRLQTTQLSAAIAIAMDRLPIKTLKQILDICSISFHGFHEIEATHSQQRLASIRYNVQTDSEIENKTLQLLKRKGVDAVNPSYIATPSLQYARQVFINRTRNRKLRESYLKLLNEEKALQKDETRLLRDVHIPVEWFPKVDSCDKGNKLFSKQVLKSLRVCLADYTGHKDCQLIRKNSRTTRSYRDHNTPFYRRKPKIYKMHQLVHWYSHLNVLGQKLTQSKSYKEAFTTKSWEVIQNIRIGPFHLDMCLFNPNFGKNQTTLLK